MTRASAPLILTAALALLFPVWLPGPALAEQNLLDLDFSRKVYYVECSGTINTKTAFQHVRAQMTITHTSQGDPNPLSVVINAEPAIGERNSFYWNSNNCAMQVLADTLRCRAKGVGVYRTDLHFYYMSPSLYRNRLQATQHEGERLKWTDAHAKPTKIFAQDGELTLRVSGNGVSGSVWMTGFDETGHEPVRYVANFQGYEYVPQNPQ
jgi:hypothetical protein